MYIRVTHDTTYWILAATHLVACVHCVVVDDNFDDLSEPSKVFLFSENISFSHPRRKTNDKDQIFLYNSTKHKRSSDLHTYNCMHTVNCL